LSEKNNVGITCLLVRLLLLLQLLQLPITNGRIGSSANPELISRVRHDVVSDNDVDQYVTGLAYRCFVITVSAPGLHTNVAFIGQYTMALDL